MLVTLEKLFDPVWYPDSGNPITPDTSTLINEVDYTLQERNMGMVKVCSLIRWDAQLLLHCIHRTLSLNYLLDVPSITKNLLSVSKFVRIIEFYLSFILTFVW